MMRNYKETSLMVKFSHVTRILRSGSFIRCERASRHSLSTVDGVVILV